MEIKNYYDFVINQEHSKEEKEQKRRNKYTNRN